MAEINLLKQAPVPQNYARSLLRILGIFLIVVFLGLVGYYVWMTISISKTNSQIAAAAAKLSDGKAAALKSQDRDELLTRQAQLTALEKLVGTHVYWSDILPELAKVTLKDAHFLSFKASNAGTLTMSIVVPSVEDFDKFLQVFDQPAFNSNFYNLRVSGMSNYVDKGITYVKFDVTMDYSPNLLKAPTQ